MAQDSAIIGEVAESFLHFLDDGCPRELVEARVEYGVLESTVLGEIHPSVPGLLIHPLMPLCKRSNRIV